MFRLSAKPSIRQTPPPARRHTAARLAVLLAALLLIAAWGAQEKQGAPTPPPVQPAAQSAAQPAAQAAAPQENKPAEYVGSSTCQGCHEDKFNALQKSPHAVVETSKKRGWEGRACEACHGPGSKHAESMSAADIQNPAKMKPAAAERTCLKCHLTTPTHINYANSFHAKNQVSCVSCHAIHKNGPNGLVARRVPEINALCTGCHSDVWASFQKPYRHRLPEGAMSCVDCHNPHGSVLPRGIETVYANEPACFRCHGEKRGPFVFEHPPVRLEGCKACHEPHGSQNPRMLTRSQVRFVCLECHANLPAPTPPANGTLGSVPPALHDLRSPRFQNCTLCHQKVHGSYVDRDLFK